MLAKGFYSAVVESVWPKDGAFGEYWQWNFRIDGQRYPLRAFTSGNLRNEKTRSFIEGVLGRSVSPDEEHYPSYFGGERCTVEVGTTIKNGREYHTIEKVLSVGHDACSSRSLARVCRWTHHLGAVYTHGVPCQKQYLVRPQLFFTPLPREGLFSTEASMPRYWATIEITRSAFADVEANTAEEAQEKVIKLLEEGEIQGWEEDVPQIRFEELPAEDA